MLFSSFLRLLNEYQILLPATFWGRVGQEGGAGLPSAIKNSFLLITWSLIPRKSLGLEHTLDAISSAT